jgi:MerR family transcriptional regulator/heat shock protein HspR
LIDKKGLNVAGVRQITSMYPCWYNECCKGGARLGGKKSVNLSKPCWKKENTYCYRVRDKSEFCSSCNIMKKCSLCNTSKCNETEK